MFLRKLLSGSIAALLMWSGSVALTAAPAAAAGVCEGLVRDNALLFAGWHARIGDYTPAPKSYWDVVEATQQLAAVGAEVRVVTLAENREDTALSRLCPQWFSGDELKPNFIVFVAIKDIGHADVLYGSRWSDKLDATALSSLVESKLVRETMTPPFYERKYSNGFIDAMAEVYRLITGNPMMPAGSQGEVGDSEGLAPWVLPVILSIALAMGLIGGFWWLPDWLNHSRRSATGKIG